jgi:AraC-like DNA-binding protein
MNAHRPGAERCALTWPDDHPRMAREDVLTTAALARLRPFLRFAREEWRGPWSIPRRIICDYLVVAVVEGRGRFQLGDATFAVGPGDVAWFPPDQPHALQGFAPRMKVLYAHFDLLHEPSRTQGVPIPAGGMDDRKRLVRWMHAPLRVDPVARWRGLLPLANAAVVRDELRRLVAEDLGDRDPAILTGSLLRLIGLIARGLSSRAIAARTHWQAMQQAADEIRAAPERTHGIRVLAAKARLSPAQFRRRFAEVHGESPRALLARARVQKARDLLLYAGDTRAIGAIAAAVGFASVHSLSRAFRRAFGAAPLAYRRDHGNTAAP